MTFKPRFTDPTILLHPNIPKPMHGVNPRSIMGDAAWALTRRKVYVSNNFCCAACGVHKMEAEYHQWMEAHEDYSIDYKKLTVTIKRIIPLCHRCHSYIHSGRLFAMAQKGEVSWQKFWDVLTGGNEVLRKAGKKPNPFAIAVALEASEGGFGDIPLWASRKHELIQLLSNNPLPGKDVDLENTWSRWRMIYDGNEYEPVFKSYDEWLAHFHPGMKRKRSKTLAEYMDDFIIGMDDIF